MPVICPRCFGDQGLKRRIEELRPTYPRHCRCTFHPKYKGVPLRDIAPIVDEVFRSHFRQGDQNHHLGEQSGDPLEIAVDELVRCEENGVREALVRHLVDNEDVWEPDGDVAFYDEAQNYEQEEPRGNQHGELWRKFCDSIVHQRRFFNTDAKALLAEIFMGLDHQRDDRKSSPIYLLTPQDERSVIFRALIARSTEERQKLIENPAQELGPPPDRVRRAGRLNPAGIAAMYMDTCVSELRTPIGSTVVGAQFRLVRPIHVFDTTRFTRPQKHMSMFTKDYIRKHEQWRFMRNFMDEITKPISPEDEHLDYIPTQVVAEYFLYHHDFKRDGATAHVEAIIYRSAQCDGGVNIVLLGDAAKVAQPDPPSRKKPRSQAIKEAFPDTMFEFLHEPIAAADVGTAYVHDSVTSMKVTGARYGPAILPALLNDEELNF